MTTTTRDLMREAVNLYPANRSPLLHFDTMLSEMKQNSMLDTFKGNLIKAGISWYEPDCIEEVKPFIRKHYPNAGTICSAVPEIRGNKDLNHLINLYELENMDVTVIRAKFGVARAGMVWIAEKDIPVRVLKHISQHLIILLHPDRMVKNMKEAYEEVYYNENNYGSFLLGYSDIYPSGSSRPLSISFCFV